MKVGDYVRFKTLSREIKIGKVIEIIEPDKESMKKYCVYDLDNKEATVDDYVIKSSPNIIDLITDDDLIEVEYPISSGMQKEVLQVINGAGGLYVNSFIRKVKLEEFNIYNFNILGIITKEQFESMEYRIGE